jgi:hypothetical protein
MRGDQVRQKRTSGRTMHHSSARLIAILVPLACVMFLTACGDDALTRHMTRPIGLNDVVGNWQLTKASLDLLIRDGYVEIPNQTYTITFNNDGWLSFESVLDDVKGGTYSKCPGTWRLHHDVTVDSEKRANVVELQLLRTNNRHFLKLLVTEEDGNLRLWNSYGDAKLTEFIEYERPGLKPKLGF